MWAAEQKSTFYGNDFVARARLLLKIDEKRERDEFPDGSFSAVCWVKFDLEWDADHDSQISERAAR